MAHCSLCRSVEGQHSTTFSPFYAPMLHGKGHRLFVGWHPFVTECLVDVRRYLDSDTSVSDRNATQMYRKVIKNSRICYCARCEFARERVLIEQRVLSGDEKAVDEFVATEAPLPYEIKRCRTT